MGTLSETHIITAKPVLKLDADGPVGYRYSCSCGREGQGWHKTPEKAELAGKAHVS